MVRTLIVAAAATTTLALAPSLAHADEPASIQPWSNVSHINGQLVPVGQRGDYLVHDPRHVNIATNPLGFLVGNYGVSASVALSEHVTIRGNIQRLDYDFFGKVDGYEVSLSAPIYLKRKFSGPFVEPGVYHRETTETAWALWHDVDETPTAHTASGPLMLFGWHWMFDSGLNVAVAAGLTRDTRYTVNGEDRSASTEPLPEGYLRIGYAL